MPSSSVARGRSPFPFFFLMTLIFAVTGCGRGQGEVTGTVTFNNKALSSGSLQFLASDGVSYPAMIQPDGSYSVRLPVGEAKVLISAVEDTKMAEFTKALASRGREGRTATVPSPLPVKLSNGLPKKYADWNASGLKVLVKPGKNQQNFDLK